MFYRRYFQVQPDVHWDEGSTLKYRDIEGSRPGGFQPGEPVGDTTTPVTFPHIILNTNVYTAHKLYIQLYTLSTFEYTLWLAVSKCARCESVEGETAVFICSAWSSTGDSPV